MKNKLLLIFSIGALASFAINAKIKFFHQGSAEADTQDNSFLRINDMAPLTINLNPEYLEQGMSKPAYKPSVEKEKTFERIINGTSPFMGALVNFEEFTSNIAQRLQRPDLLLSGLIELSFLQDFERELQAKLKPKTGTNFVKKKINSLVKIAEKTLNSLSPTSETAIIGKNFLSQKVRKKSEGSEQVKLAQGFLKFIRNELHVPGIVNGNKDSSRGGFIDGLNQLEMLLEHDLSALLPTSTQLQQDVLKIIRFAAKQGEKFFSHNNLYGYEKKLSEILVVIEKIRQKDNRVFNDLATKLELANLHSKLTQLKHQRLTAPQSIEKDKIIRPSAKEQLQEKEPKIKVTVPKNTSHNLFGGKRSGLKIKKTSIKKRSPTSSDLFSSKKASGKRKKLNVILVNEDLNNKPTIIKENISSQLVEKKKRTSRPTFNEAKNNALKNNKRSPRTKNIK